MRREHWICLALAAVTALVYAQVVGFDYVDFDDPAYIIGCRQPAGRRVAICMVDHGLLAIKEVKRIGKHKAGAYTVGDDAVGRQFDSQIAGQRLDGRFADSRVPSRARPASDRRSRCYRIA